MTTTPSTTLGAALRMYRQRAGLSQHDLATAAGVSVRTVRELEQDRVGRPRPQSVAALAAALNLPDGERQCLLAAPVRAADQSRTGLSVRVLGPLVIERDGAVLELTGGKRRRLLVLLALHANEPVTRAAIVDALWGERPPPSYENLVHTYVGALRRLLEPGRTATGYRVLVRSGDGYRLLLDQTRLDLLDFLDLLEQARAVSRDGAPERARECYARALACWRGPLLGGADPVLSGHPAAVALAANRVEAVLGYADLAAGLGHHDEVVLAVRRVLADEPLHEGIHARLIRALAATGQQAGALRLYEAVRERLVRELGVDPGAELRAAHLDVLHQRGSAAGAPTVDPAVRPAPAQLPFDVHGFTGRRFEIGRLDSIASTVEARSAAVVISTLSGTAGVGKTALAVHWAHRVAGSFPDGQLYANLRGFDPSQDPVNPSDVRRGFLDALGVAPHTIPMGEAEQIGLYRSLLAGRRVLMVLDNAYDADQVRPLLPGSAGCMVVVTSRSRLTGLVAVEGAHPLPLDLLSIAEAREFLTRRLGRDRTAAAPRAVEEIIAGCAQLPLALAIVAARAATEPGLALATLAQDLRDTRTGLDTLDGGDLTTDVRAVFSWSYRALSEPAARLFRLLGAHAGADLSLPAAASLAGLPPARTRELLTELTNAHLITEDTPGRYGFHDLLRAYAAELAERLDPEAVRAAALHRLLDHYLLSAYPATQRMYPHRELPDLPAARTGVTPEPAPAEAGDAVEWFAAERQNLLAALPRSAAAGFDSHTWQLAWTLVVFLDRRGLWRDWVATQQAALAAAERLGDLARQAYSQRSLGGAYSGQGRHEDAEAHFERALALYRELDDPAGQATVHYNLGHSLERRGRFTDALPQVERAYQLHRAAGNHMYEAAMLNALGWLHAQLGDYRRTVDCGEEAIRLFETSGYVEGTAIAWDSLGYAHHRLGDHPRAVTCYGRALDLLREADSREQQAQTLIRLGETHQAMGAADDARAVWERALDILDELAHPDADRVRERLVTTKSPAI